MVVLPLILPTFDWKSFVQVFGNNSIKRLDAEGIDIKDPAALFTVFNQTRSIQESIANDPYVRKLIYMSFLIETEDAMVKDILINTDLLSVYFRNDKEPELGALILTGSIASWFESINSKLVKSSKFRIRLLYGKVFLYFQQSYLRFMWVNYDRKKLSDETFILIPK